MNFLDIFKTNQKIEGKETYNFLVVAALQEELNEFYKLEKSFSRKIEKEGGAFEVELDFNGSKIKILTFSPNNMGMPINATYLMDIVLKHNPIYTFMIGTCACLNDKHKIGDVLVPDRIFSYESGKYESGKFMPDYFAHSTSGKLRKQAELLKSIIGKKIQFSVIADEDFCSGAAVIDDSKIVANIKKYGSRKLSGLDMESYAIACMNTLFKGEKDLLVIKGISDYAKQKSESEKKGNKELAKKNSAKFALHLIKHLQKNTFIHDKKIKLNKN